MIHDVFKKVEKLNGKETSLIDLDKAVNEVNRRYSAKLNDDDEVYFMWALSDNCKTHCVKPIYDKYIIVKK